MTDQAALALSYKIFAEMAQHVVFLSGMENKAAAIETIRRNVAEALAGQEEGTTDAALVTRITSALYNCADELDQENLSSEEEAAIVERYVTCILRAVRKSEAIVGQYGDTSCWWCQRDVPRNQCPRCGRIDSASAPTPASTEPQPHPTDQAAQVRCRTWWDVYLLVRRTLTPAFCIECGAPKPKHNLGCSMVAEPRRADGDNPISSDKKIHDGTAGITPHGARSAAMPTAPIPDSPHGHATVTRTGEGSGIGRTEPDPPTPVPDAPDAVRELARRLHEWYLEATQALRPDNYNPNAQKSFDELNEEQRSIDIFIAHKITSALAKARLEEAEWWEHLVGYIHPDHSENHEPYCMYCQRMAELRRASQEQEGK